MGLTLGQAAQIMALKEARRKNPKLGAEATKRRWEQYRKEQMERFWQACPACGQRDLATRSIDPGQRYRFATCRNPACVADATSEDRENPGVLHVTGRRRPFHPSNDEEAWAWCYVLEAANRMRIAAAVWGVIVLNPHVHDRAAERTNDWFERRYGRPVEGRVLELAAMVRESCSEAAFAKFCQEEF